MTQRERRLITVTKLEVRAKDDKKKIAGYAAKFNEFSEPFWDSWVERILPGAFKNALEKSDVRGLFNHDVNFVLGRQSAGTLTLTEDDVGLYFEIDPPDTQQARDIVASIERGDITGCSFSFTVHSTNWEVLNIDGRQMDVRNILAFEEIFDVGPVTFPAYPSTDVGVRSKTDLPDFKPVQRSSDVDIKLKELNLKSKEVY